MAVYNNNGKDMETAGDRFQQLIDKASAKRGRRVSDREISRALGCSATTIGKWRRKDELDKDTCVEIAQYFNERHNIGDVRWRWIRDGDPGPGPQIDWRLIHSINQAIGRAVEEEHVRIDPLSKAWAIIQSVVYRNAQRDGRIDNEVVREQVLLASLRSEPEENNS